MDAPEISIIMASYNYARFICEAIDSVLAQSVTNWELIIVDDGSTDESLAVIKSYCDKDKRLSLHQHADAANHGLPCTLELALKQVRGRYIAFLESDDAWTPDCLEKRLERLKYSGADAVFNHITVFGENVSEKTGDVILVYAAYKKFQHSPKGFQLQNRLLFENCIPTFSCIMLKAAMLAGVDMAAPVPRWLDWWMWQQAASKGNFTYLDAACTRWRMHAGSYNRKRGFSAFCTDARLMWRAFRLSVPKWRVSLSVYERGFLAMPFIVPLGLRFLSVLQSSGLKGLSRRILSKLKLN